MNLRETAVYRVILLDEPYSDWSKEIHVPTAAAARGLMGAHALKYVPTVLDHGNGAEWVLFFRIENIDLFTVGLRREDAAWTGWETDGILARVEPIGPSIEPVTRKRGRFGPGTDTRHLHSAGCGCHGSG